MIRKILFLLGALSAVSAHAEIFSIGVLGGASFTDVVNATNQNNFNFVSTSSNFTVGPSFQINLPFHLRVEGDALYRPYSFTATCSLPAPGATCVAPVNVSASQWRFPILAAYRFSFPVVKPFVESGVSFNHLSDISSSAQRITSGAGEPLDQTHAAFVIGGGVDVKVPFVRVSGELRYTHQGSSDFASISTLNQAEVLVGIHF
jgi:hypothetical protein